MAVHHPLFMVRESRLVRPAGPRKWTPVASSVEASVEAITKAARAGVSPYIYDVDGVEAKAAQFQFYQRLEQSHAMPWIHAGCRTPEDAMDTFFAGAEAITVESRHMDERVLAELAGLAEGEIHVGVTAARDMLRPRDLARLVREHNLNGVVVEATVATAAPADAAVAELHRLQVPVTVLSLEASALPGYVLEKADRVARFGDA